MHHVRLYLAQTIGLQSCFEIAGALALVTCLVEVLNFLATKAMGVKKTTFRDDGGRVSGQRTWKDKLYHHV